MSKNNFDDVLDYGLFKEDESTPLEIPTDVDWEKFKYFTKIKSREGETILFRSKYSSIRPNEGDIGFLGGARLMNDKFYLPQNGWIILIEDGFLTKWLRLEKYTDKWTKIDFEIETVFPYGIQLGSPVFINGKPAPDGKYYKGRFSSIAVMDGKVDKL
ncbi:MAG: hypothetical protein AB8H03_24435 [Saprospiraceae bacterium]